jgi:hypothetical protein
MPEMTGLIKLPQIMKKFFLIPAVIALAFISSCTEKEQEIENTLPDEELGSGITEFNATLLTTKTQLGTPTGSEGSREWPNLWSNGDQINVNGENSAALSTGDGYVGTDYAIFTMANAVSGPYYAAYPASAVSNYSAGSATVTIPATQTFVDGSYDPAAYIMLAKSDNATLNFTPMMGLVQLTTTAPAEGTLYIKSITVESVGDEKMSGAFTTTTNYAGIEGGATSSITINAPNNTSFGTVFTFALPAQNYASGVRFRITANTAADGSGDDKVAVFAKQSAFNVAAGTLYPLTAPAFKESGVTISLIRALTSSSIQIRWNGSNVSNNKSKTWRIHAYTDSACNSEFGSGWTIPKENASCWDSDNSYLTFCIGGLARATKYWFKVEDVQNGTMSAASSITTQSFSQVSMPASITSTGVVLAEDFNELPWGSTVCFRRSAGFRPSNSSSFSNLSTDGASFYDWGSDFSFRADYLDDALTSSRLNNWMSEGSVAAKPGHIKLGTSTAAGWIVTPAFPVASGKNAIVNVTLDATKYNSDAQSEYAIAVLSSSLVGSGSGNRESSFTWPDTSDESLYQTVSFSSNSEWQSRTAEGLVLSPGDRIVIGRRNGANNTNPRLFINSITVEATAIIDDIYKIKDVASLQYFMTNKPDAAIVTADIDMNGQSFTSIAGYTGNLYGNGHTISGLTVPMFDELKGSVRDLTLNSTLNITSKHADASGVGIFARKMTNNSSLNGCTSKGSLVYCPSSAFTSKEQRVGGLVGYLNLGSLTNCKNEASVTMNDNGQGNNKAINLGGIAGQAYNSSRQYITSCTNAGNVTNNCNTDGAIYVGGICGKPYAVTIQDCKNENVSSDITVTNSGSGSPIAIGGAFGMIQNNCILNGVCYNKEAVSNTGTGSVRIGGFVGQGDTKNTYNASSTTYHYNDGDVTENSASTSIFVGGFCGYANNANVNISYCRNNGDVTISGGTRETIYVGGVIGYTSALVPFNYVQNSGDITFSGVTVSGQVFCGGIHGGWNSDSDGTQTVTGCVNSGKITSSSAGDLESSSAKWSFFGGISGVGGGDADMTSNGQNNTTGFETITGKTFTNCTNTGAINLNLKTYFVVGGIISVAENNPAGCTCTANITAIRTQGNSAVIRNRCGGIAGYSYAGLAAVSDLKYDGTIYTYGSKNLAYTAGLIGFVPLGLTFTNCKVGGSIRGAGSGAGASIFSNSSTANDFSFSSCAVKKGTLVYCYSKETINSNSDLNTGNCMGPEKSSTNTDGTLATQVSVPTSL